MVDAAQNPKRSGDVEAPTPASERATVGMPGAAVSTDLTDCDREPIHSPGCIQPHGILLALDASGCIRVASANAPSVLGRTMEQILGHPLRAIFEASVADRLRAQLTEEPLAETTRLLAPLELPDGRLCEVVAYRTERAGEPLACLEFEFSSTTVNVVALNSRLYNFVAAIRRMQSATEICQAAVDEIFSLTGCDRVVLYQFNDGGHGVVLAEKRAHDHVPTYLGLRFPASDVPHQARRLYEINRIRIIPDVNYAEVPLLGNDGPEAGIDMTGSILRSVSPVHRQYMRNMGTACSMSTSILMDGRLWGLVSCHHPEPRLIPLRLRSACDFLMQIVASQMESQQNAAHLRSLLRASEAQGHLLARMAEAGNYMDGLKGDLTLLAQLVKADGVALVSGVEVSRYGHTPESAQILKLADWLRDHREEDMIVSSRLPEIYPPARAFAHKASGVLAVALSKLHNTQILWFRQEQVRTVRWAGNPQKPVQITAGSAGLSPRHSFEDWAEVVRGTAEPWSQEEVSAARDFRLAVLEIVLRRAEELAEMATQLQIANEELEAFSYSVSHDLRAPFRHISGFSEMLKEHEAQRMTDRGKRYLDTIMESAHFAGLLVDSLLEFSRIARSKLVLLPIDMQELVDSEWKAVAADEGEGRQVQFERGDLPKVMGDPRLMRQVLRNLFSNALKYTSRSQAPQVRMMARAQGQEYVFSISDNGVGFDQEYAGKLFGVFQRLHRIEDFEGTGIGLANVRRIVGRHGGRVWAEGVIDAGATFYFTLPTLFPREDV
jgi:chemotaxis family two-component system sensor kinase Cph1